MPLLPKTPFERFTISSMFRNSRVSMSNGLPIQKCLSSSSPNTVRMSVSVAVPTREK